MSTLMESPPWQALQAHYAKIKNQSMSDWFAEDKQRFQRFSIEAAGILLDFSKNRITSETLTLLAALAAWGGLDKQRSALFAGEIVNRSEQRAAMHTALRNISDQPQLVDDVNVMPNIQQSWEQMAAIVSAINRREYVGFAGKPIDTIVNIGIGGSDFGPQLLLSALAGYVNPELNYHFLSTHDAWVVNRVLSQLNPATTLFIVVSKSFTTEETLANADMAKAWLAAACPDVALLSSHLIAVTAESERAQEWGALPQNILAFWDWVGGRYSIWSAVSLVVAIAIGMPQFKAFLSGGFMMDQHFQTAAFEQNMPVILALLDIWYHNFFQAESRVILPYGQRLRLLPDYLQQLHMESLGKRVTQNGEVVDYQTGGILWGSIGTNSQHSFHQLLMQGTHLVPADFVLALDQQNPLNPVDEHLLSHCLAQTQVLMQGEGVNKNKDESPPIAIERVIPGNVPTNTVLLSDLSPAHVGALLALYEHKVFTYAAILNINPFDQWGVERGKRIAKQIKLAMHDSQAITCYDSSTQGLLAWVKKNNVAR